MSQSKKDARVAKLLKKQANQRTLEERRIEIDKIYEKLYELGINDEMLKEFKTIADDYINIGFSCSGSITIEGIERKLLYSFTMDKRHPVSSMLKKI